jgi:very-short-patch-repair endonuclease
MDHEKPRRRRDRGTEPAYGMERRRELRESQTTPEQLVWAMVRGRRLLQCKFRRQHSVGPYIVDFVCLEAHLVLELDGDYHDYVVEEDQRRTEFLNQQGFQVLRFWNQDVMQDADSVGRAIEKALREKLKESTS